ncbi:integrase [Massilia violaceinigra]|uniref:Integrase n=1 Tax=Massilia violaceinigra TaxID=2045208 RepID=A0A2D2DSB1_9BURK|nr:tyrosine-type recombinase/integrase [Massilia violaceinigra]ATQ77859.1 integrase [Massilia violaceinigra]
MGRKPTKNLHLPPGMRARVQKSGKIYYYFDQGGRPRTEIPLGGDYILALQEYVKKQEIIGPGAGAKFGDVIAKYEAEVLHTHGAKTIQTNKSDLKHLKAFFADAPLSQVRPMHIKQFLTKHADKPTTANRCKRLFSALWNRARGWGYTDAENPCTGIMGHELEKREVYITDAVFHAVRAHASAQLVDALDLAYLTGQRPGDTTEMHEDHIDGEWLLVEQGKTGKRLRMMITGELAELLARIAARKVGCKESSGYLLVNASGRRMTRDALRYQYEKARGLAANGNPELSEAIKKMWFYDLRAKAADDSADERGEQAASDLLGHDSVKTTRRHYLRRGKIVPPTK